MCSYRIFIRYKNLNVGEYSDDAKTDPNHPWLGGRGSDTFWTPVDGYDLTGFCILKIDDELKNIRSFNDGKSIYVSKYEDKENFQKTDYIHIKATDARLLHIKDDLFLMSYNVYKRDATEISGGIKCNDDPDKTCTLIATRYIEIKNGNLHIYEQHLVCPSISKYTEKNWSFWLYNNEIFFSYGLSPEHKFYKYNFGKDIILCPSPSTDDRKVYGEYEKSYNNIFPILNISVSTPSIPRRGNKNKYIGVGHIKYLNNPDFVERHRESPLGSFYFKNLNKIKHQTHDYLMFIYEFDPKSGKLLSISDMFIPENTNYMLCFPTGLAYKDDKLMIFYGDHDSTCNILMFEDEILNKILKPVGEDYFSTIKTISYFFFPEKCISKKDFCALIYNF